MLACLKKTSLNAKGKEKNAIFLCVVMENIRVVSRKVLFFFSTVKLEEHMNKNGLCWQQQN